MRDATDKALEAWEHLYPNSDVLPLAVVERLIRTARLMQERLGSVASDHGIRNRGDYEVIRALRRLEPMTSLEIAHELRISTSGVTGRLDRLESLGLIDRSVHPVDRRAVSVGLTARGRNVSDEIFGAALAFQEGLLQPLSRTQRTQMADNLRELLVALGDLSPELRPTRDAPSPPLPPS